MNKLNKIAGLDALRGVAILLVFFNHTFSGVIFGGFGVYLFFVLSGFLSARSLMRERTHIAAGRSTVGEAAQRFVAGRMTRVFPVYLTAIGFVFLLDRTVVPGLLQPGELARHLTFTTNLYLGEGGRSLALGHLWSMSVQEQYLMLLAPLVLFGAATSWRLCLFLLFAATILFGFKVSEGVPFSALYHDSFVSFGLIAVGGLLAHLDPAKWRARLSDTFPAMMLIFYVTMPWCLGALVAGRISADPMLWWLEIVRRLAILPIAALVLAVWVRPDSWIVRTLEGSPFSALGRLSFGIYAYHLAITPENIRAMTYGQIDFTAVADGWQALLVLMASIGMAVLSRWAVEQPAMKLKKYLSPKVRERGVLEGEDVPNLPGFGALAHRAPTTIGKREDELGLVHCDRAGVSLLCGLPSGGVEALDSGPVELVASHRSSF